VSEQTVQLPMPNRAVVRGNGLTGDIRLDSRPSTVTLDLQALFSDQPKRDDVVRNLFRAHPTAVLTVPSVAELPERYESRQTVKQTLEGTLALNGLERPVSFEVEAFMDGSVLNILAKTSFDWKDFDIPPPKSLTAEVRGPVAVEVLLVARPRAG
jgi:polyisoprenoid-binding protein YceI